jgi:hypothetical protein
MSTPKTDDRMEADLHFWADPNDVLSDPTMTVAEKRTLLASWASDVRAVPDHPALRQLEDGALVTIDAVLDALERLDDSETPARPNTEERWSLKRHWSRLGRRWRKHFRDDDDDDPFSPAPAMPRPRFPALDGAAAMAA